MDAAKINVLGCAGVCLQGKALVPNGMPPPTSAVAHAVFEMGAAVDANPLMMHPGLAPQVCS